MEVKKPAHFVLDEDYVYICYQSSIKQPWEIHQQLSIEQLKISQIHSTLDNSPTTPSSLSSQKSDTFSNNSFLFSLSLNHQPLGIYAVQSYSSGLSWAQALRQRQQKKPACTIEEDLFSNLSGWCGPESSIQTSNTSTALDLESKPYDTAQRYHPDLIRSCQSDHRIDIVGGSAAALIHELLLTKDRDYMRVFLLNYSSFTTGSIVLNEIQAIVSDFGAKLDGQLLSLFTMWCKEFGLDVIGDVASGMISIIDSITSLDTSTLKELALSTVAENAKQVAGNETSKIPNDAETSKTSDQIKSVDDDWIDLSSLTVNSLTAAFFLTLSPQSFADQIYLFHFSQHVKHRQALVDPLSYLPRPQTMADMLNSLLFTSSSPHFLTKLIRNHVLIDSQQPEGALLRARILKQWILVGIRLYELKDMSGWCAVALGICSAGVVRLREAWKLVDRSMVQLVKTQWTVILAEYGLFDQSLWSENWEKEICGRYTEVLHLNDPDSLPFFGTIRHTIDRLKRNPSKMLGPKVVNFEECRTIYIMVRNSLDQWKQKSNHWDVRTTQILAIRSLQLFFELSVTDLASAPHNLKYLQEASVACEPRIFGRVLEHHKFRPHQPATDVLPPSHASLQFPKILDNCTLFENSTELRGENEIQDTENSAQEVCSNSTEKKWFKRRTLDFYSSIDLTLASVDSRRHDVLKSLHSRFGFGAGRQGSINSSKVSQMNTSQMRLRLADSNLVVSHGDLLFKASALLRRNKKDCFSVKEIDLLDSPSNSKRGNMQKLDFKESLDASNQSELLVNIKGASFDCLVDCLVTKLHPYQEDLKDQWNTTSLPENDQELVSKIVMDEENFISTFFGTYRSHCSSTHLLNMFHKKYLNAKAKCKLTARRKNPTLKLVETYFTESQETVSSSLAHQEEIEVNSYDWNSIALICNRILTLIVIWVEEYPYDFVDDIEFVSRVYTFLGDAREDLEDWRSLLELYLLKDSLENEKREGLVKATSRAEELKETINKLESLLIQNSLSPCYDMGSDAFDVGCLQSAHSLYQQLMHGSQLYKVSIQPAVSKRVPLVISHEPLEADIVSLIDSYTPEYLLSEANENARQLLLCIDNQDWLQASDVIEAQCSDLYAWLPARKPSRTSKISTAFAAVMGVPSSYCSDRHILYEDVVISDIFSAIQGARRSVVFPSAFSDDDLLLAFPGSIQHLYCMHYILRSWAIHEISCSKIDLKTRTQRIQKFLKIIMLSQMHNEKKDLFPELEKAEKRIPGFVENAIASALVSPEVRLFTKAWNDISTCHATELDSLESLISKMQLAASQSELSSNQDTVLALVPSLGWIMDRIIEICFHFPETKEKKGQWVDFEKKFCLHRFLKMILNVQSGLNEQKTTESPSLSFLVSPNPTKANWECLKERAARENKKGSVSGNTTGISLLSSSGKSQACKTVFSALVNKQMEKIKKDFKERDRVDKDWLTLQYKMQKKQMDQLKFFEKQDKTQSVIPRINSFFKGLRPISMVSGPTNPLLSAENNESQLTSTKASTVINLIHSTTSIASTYTKRDFVFRVVTEEGGQYLFQGMNRQDLDEWMRQINGAAREGAVKRQSVLAAESLDSECERRRSAILNETPRNQQVPDRKSVYGVSLEVLMCEMKVPVVVEKCIQEIEKRGLEEVGIYRVAGTGSIVTALKTEFNKNIDNVDLSDSKWADINVIADAFKQFLRELPEPLLTYTYYDEFINASASGDHDQRVYLIKEVIKKLPFSNYILLKRITEHFVTVTDFEAINHMYATNLAIVFGPTLLQPAPGPASFATTMSNLGHHQNIVKYLVLNYHYLFDIESDDVDSKEQQSLQ
ncbi:hypothetical protein BY458DRAFT_440511 [Sporodiniella umbellata]|nr:hypothetical protein BY458DRAFT_440511 [Sporodiniella umbellata]